MSQHVPNRNSKSSSVSNGSGGMFSRDGGRRFFTTKRPATKSNRKPDLLLATPAFAKENWTIASTVSSFTFTATKCNIFWNIQNMWESWNQLDSTIHTFGSCHKSPPNLWTTPSECPNAPSNEVTVFQDPRRPVSRAPYWQLPVWMS